MADMENDRRGSDGKPFPTRDGEAKDYLEDHKVLELFNNLTAQLIYNRPDEPKKFMVDVLERLQKSKITKLDYPCIFDDSNVHSVFGMLDPTSRGYITLQQYNEALVTLGVTGFNDQPEGAQDNKITFDTFQTEARQGLSKASATFSDI